MSNINYETFFKAFPTIGTPRNRFPFEKEINFDMDMGKITPICAIRVQPGQTYNLDISTIIKVAPLQQTPMDNAVFKTFAFYQQDSNTWTNYKYWFGEEQSPENPELEPTYLVPKVQLPTSWTDEKDVVHTGFPFNSFYDNIGCPPEKGGYKIDAYLPRTDRDIYNTYFRNQSLENPLPVNRGDEDDDPWQNMELRRICKPRDFFTQLLPNATGRTNVEIPLGTEAPVIATGNKTLLGNTNTPYGQQTNLQVTGVKANSTADKQTILGYNNQESTKGLAQWLGDNSDITSGGNWGNIHMTSFGAIRDGQLKAMLSQATGAPLEVLYNAIAYNTYNYIKSRGGSRYFEILSNVYKIANPETVLHLPEFLGSTSQMIEFDTVTQTSATTDTPLGHRVANGYMENFGSIVNKSFGQFGWILIYGAVTYYPKYQQGVSKLMQTEDPLDLFNPIFNLVGDEPIYRSELYTQPDTEVNEEGTPINDEVFGYGKRNSRILYPVNEIHGKQRSSYPQSLDTYHFAEYYKEMPTLNKEWDKVSDKGFKRCLMYQDEPQFICNTIVSGTQDIEIPTDAIPSPIPFLEIQ